MDTSKSKIQKRNRRQRTVAAVPTPIALALKRQIAKTSQTDSAYILQAMKRGLKISGDIF